MKMTHTPVPIPRLLALAPSWDQGDSAERPRPVPRMTRISERTAAAAAPAKIPPHATALAWEQSSVAAGRGGVGWGEGAAGGIGGRTGGAPRWERHCAAG